MKTGSEEIAQTIMEITFGLLLNLGISIDLVTRKDGKS